MTLRERAASLAKSVFRALQASPNDDQEKAATDVIEKAIINIVLEERQRCANVASAQPCETIHFSRSSPATVHLAMMRL